MSKKRGRNINLFLMEGEATGRIKGSMANWTGLAFKIPRTHLDICKDREDLKQSGVYFLFGVADETGENVVYIGQAGARKNGEGILNRLMEHKRDESKDYWTEAVVFTTSNNTFGPTEISYLENRFCNLAITANRYLVKNANDPNPGHVTEEKESELEEFIDNAKILMGTFGHKVFEPIIDDSQPTASSSYVDSSQSEVPVMHMRSPNYDASGKPTSEGFVVLKGSRLNKVLAKSMSKNAREEREKAQDKGIIDNDFILQENVLLMSPSAAAGFVGGYSLSGNITWKTADGLTLSELEEKSL